MHNFTFTNTNAPAKAVQIAEALIAAGFGVDIDHVIPGTTHLKLNNGVCVICVMEADNEIVLLEDGSVAFTHLINTKIKGVYKRVVDSVMDAHCSVDEIANTFDEQFEAI